MKKAVILFSLVLGLLGSKHVDAQMAAAKTIVWDLEINVNVKISKGSVWRIISDNEKLQKYSNGYIKSIRTIDEELVESREVVFTNGKKRSETIKQTDYVNKFMVIGVNQTSLPKGIKSAEIAIFTKDIDEENSNILWAVQIEGRKAQKQKLIEQLTDEFNSYVKGFSSIKN